MTKKQKLCLNYLSDKMEANAAMIGEAIYGSYSAYLPTKGAAVAGHLVRKGLVMRIPELNAWRLTGKGREWVLQAKTKQEVINDTF